MEKAQRNALRAMVTECRRILEQAIRDLMESRYGIHASGQIESFDRLRHLDSEEQRFRSEIVARIEHIQATVFGGKAGSGAVEQLVREVAFTHLNRLCAFKMLERRRLIREAVSRGQNSSGFMFYLADHPADEALWSGGRQDLAYRHFLLQLGEDLSNEIGALFSPLDPANRLFPGQAVIDQILARLNNNELKDIWEEDETIGWVYQYFTPKELRDKARKESSAPRNSYELAFRNQFYTPRYVVEFLVENTLGRAWYEMRRGETSVADSCKYLVHRKRTIFLDPATQPPVPFRVGDAWGDPDLPGEMWIRPNPELSGFPDLWEYALTVGGYGYARDYLGVECGNLANERMDRYHQTKRWEGTFEELRCCLFFEQRRWHHFGNDPEGEALEAIEVLNQAICSRWDLEVEHVLFREKKDPREISILDPACGSGHFLLSCFNLLETIYAEAYDDPDLRRSLQRDYPDREEYLRAVPELILLHNLHGIDIDLRAVQIAALALWMRVQRAYQDLGLERRDRPAIVRANVVCAEPMPGEKDLLEEFISDLRPAALSGPLRAIFEKMKLAGESGSLLKIEEEIREEIAEAKRRWKGASRGEQLTLFAEKREQQAEQHSLFDAANMSDEAFWIEAEGRLFDALRAYADRASISDDHGTGYLRRLFREDAQQGFGFIDICRQKFDVVLMNPPFGEPSKPSRNYIQSTYPISKEDLYAAFVERGLYWLHPRGLLGAITSRTGFFLSSFQRWREGFLLKTASLRVFADLGQGVLDTAMVETSAYCMERSSRLSQNFNGGRRIAKGHRPPMGRITTPTMVIPNA